MSQSVSEVEVTAHRVPVGVDRHLLLMRKRSSVGIGHTPVLMLHGSTLPGSVAFDLAVDGMSWMDDLARHSGDAWSLDLRGFGGSWKPDVVRLADGREQPVVRTTDAMEDVRAAIRFIHTLTGQPQIDLLGWSWGATIVGAVAGSRPDGLRRVVLHAPQWVRTTPSRMVTAETLSSSYRTTTFENFRDRWLNAVGEGPRDEIRRKGWDEALRAAFPSDGRLRVPNGSIQDIAEYWSAARPFYDPGTIGVPVLVVVGAEDRETPTHQAEAIAARIPDAQLAIIPEGTHFMFMEPARAHLFAAVNDFIGAKECARGNAPPRNGERIDSEK